MYINVSHIKNIGRIRNCLYVESGAILIHDFIASNLDYCNLIIEIRLL